MTSDNHFFNNELFLFYDMMIKALSKDDISIGLEESLNLLKKYLNSENVILFRKDKHFMNSYSIYSCSSNIENKSIFLSILDDTYKTNVNNTFLSVDCDLFSGSKNIIFIRIFSSEYDYILSICNCDFNKISNDSFLSKLEESMSIILKRAGIYEKNMQLINIDILTGFNNRNSYENRINNLKAIECNLIFGLFDLFRLKFVNDNYSHSLGDKYIVETARILRKYWPVTNWCENDSTINNSSVFSNIYRVGGDEFILLSNSDLLDSTLEKAKKASEEVGSIDLGIEIPIGLNYGIVSHNLDDCFRNTYIKADKILSSDKQKMYKKFNLDRRK